jgi:Domain of unknown function (DUF4382)
MTTNPVTKRLVAYGAVGLVIAIVLIAGLQVRPQDVLQSTGKLQISMTSDPLATNPLSVRCHGNSSHGSQIVQSQNITITSLEVSISSIQVHRTGALNLTGDWITLPNAPKMIDLLNLKSFGQLSSTMPDGVINLVRLTVGSTATASTSAGPKTVTISSGHLDAQTSAQVISGKVTSITLEVVQPHVVCANGDLKLTPELTVTSTTTD